MEALVHNISQVLGITVINSLWQGLIIYLLLRILLGCAPSLSAIKKHNISLGGVMVLGIWFMITLVKQISRVDWGPAPTAEAWPSLSYIPQMVVNNKLSVEDTCFYTIRAYLPFITVVYITGLLFNTLKLCFAWRNINLVRKSARKAGMLEATVDEFCRQLNITRKVLVSYSAMVDVPGVIGYFKPVLLLPLAITNQLSTAEVEAILLHELSHIKRNDYLLNVLQQIISVLLFFNPFALLINRVINSERENCCDDMVVNLTGEPLTYARALLKLEESKQNTLQLALAATGKKHFLLNRIERIMTTKKLTVNVRHLLAAVILFTFSLGSIAWLNPEIKNDRIVLNVKNPIRINLFADTVPAKKASPKAVVAKKSAVAGKQKFKQTSAFQVNTYNINDPEMERLSKQMEKYGEAIDKYYNSAEFKKLTEDMDRTGKEMDAYYNGPEVKKLQDDLDAASKKFSDMADCPEVAKLNKDMDEASKNLDKYYNSPEFKKMEAELDKESALLDKSKAGTAAFEAHLKKVKELSEKVHKYTSNEKIRAQSDNIRALGDKIRDFYSSEDYRKQQAEVRALGDSLRSKFQTGMIKKQQESMRLYGEKIRAYQNNSEIMRQRKLMEETGAKMRAYMNSPAFKKKMQQARTQANIDRQNSVGIWTDHLESADSIEKPEQPEKPEHPEKVEQPEKPETPEQ